LGNITRRIGPLLELRALPSDVVRRLRLDRIAVRHGDRRLEHFRERKPSILGEHHEDPARRARRDRREGPVAGWIGVSLRLEEFRRGAGRRDAERVDADDLLRMRVVDEGLRLAAQCSVSHIVAVAAIIAHAASTAFPPLRKVFAPRSRRAACR
jgi:hypothetical protein